MRLDTQARDRDKVFEEFGARVFGRSEEPLYLNGTHPRVPRNVDAPGLCIRKSQRRPEVAAAAVLHGVKQTSFAVPGLVTP